MSLSAIGLSGLLSAQTRLDGTASNVANVATSGPVPKNAPNQPIATPAIGPGGDQVYQAVEPQTQAVGGGALTRLAPGLPSYIQQFQPDSPDANAEGLVAAPNVDLGAAATSQIADAAYFKANAIVVKVTSEIEKDAINLIA